MRRRRDQQHACTNENMDMTWSRSWRTSASHEGRNTREENMYIFAHTGQAGLATHTEKRYIRTFLFIYIYINEIFIFDLSFTHSHTRVCTYLHTRTCLQQASLALTREEPAASRPHPAANETHTTTATKRVDAYRWHLSYVATLAGGHLRHSNRGSRQCRRS